MKIDRLLSIVILLINRRHIQAKELAEMFEVSVRTIYRDIETINTAGIPVITTQGAGGGISLMEGYRLDRNVLTDTELADIFTALQGVSSSGGITHSQLLEKISSIIPPSRSAAFRSRTTQFVVDFSPLGLNRSLEARIALLKDAIEDTLAVSFDYVDAEGIPTHRSVEPYTLVLKGQAWYLYGHCGLRGDFRLFKLLRMKCLVQEQRTFIRQQLPAESLPWSGPWLKGPSGDRCVLHISAEGRHLAEDRFDASELQPDGSGGYYVTITYPEDSWLYGFLLSFGTALEILEPASIRDKVREIAAGIAAKYKE